MSKAFTSRIYLMLKAAGHTPAKAIEIILDAKRGDRLAIDRIKGIRRLSR